MSNKKPRKVKPFTPAWNKRADELARSYAPPILACVECRQPIVSGYCCAYCGSGKGGLDEEGNKP